MRLADNNHLALLEIKPTPRVSTPAQRAAAQLNGSKSSGPKTPEGKLRSSQNSLKHGLLARRLTPPADARDDDILYRSIHRQLMEQFAPQTFWDRETVGLLANDLVQLKRAREFMEVLQRPATLAPEEMARWSEAREAKRDLKALRQPIKALDGGDALSCNPQSARRLAKRVAANLESLREYLYPTTEVTAVADMDADEREEYEAIKMEWQNIRPIVKKLLDQERLVSVLVGSLEIRSAERKRLRSVLDGVVKGLTTFIAFRTDLQAKLERHSDQQLLALAMSPERLLSLRRYATKIELAIDRKIRSLSKR